MCDNKKMSNISTNVDIDLGSDFVTQKSAANMLLSIAKFLLFNRNQIPFVYETFYFMTKKLEKCRSACTEHGVSSTFVKNYAIERQRDVAIQTYRKFNEISDIILKSFENHEMEQAIISFGATTFTSKEAFIINLPTVSKNHFAVNHPNSTETITRKVIRSIITSKNFFDVNYSELKPTNMYVILKPRCHGLSSIGDEFRSHSSFKFPASCRTTHINIENNSSKNAALNCCRSLNIFNDNEISNEYPVKCETFEKNEDRNLNGIKNRIEKDNTSTTHNSFYECNIVVKGYRDHLIKGKSIWTQHET